MYNNLDTSFTSGKNVPFPPAISTGYIAPVYEYSIHHRTTIYFINHY